MRRNNMIRSAVSFLLAASLIAPTPAMAATIRERVSKEPQVWAYDAGYGDWEKSIADAIKECVPQLVIKEFNKQGYMVVISSKNCDEYQIAGLTSGKETQKSGWYTWADDNQRYMELTPTYGLHSAQMTALHEFGHVLDMMTGATADPEALADIESEMDAYNQVMQKSGYLIPEMKDGHELFAQVFASVISGNTGYVNCAKEVAQACPVTAAYVQGIIDSF